MKVSVVTTVYNGESYFDRAVPSILGQTYKTFEWIIVDDGSTDQTLPLLRQLTAKDPRVRVLTPGRLGVARAANFGIYHAKGEYIVRQDFDDVSYPTRIERQVAFLDSCAEIGVVGAQYILVDQNRSERYLRMPPVEHKELVRAMARYIPFAHTLVTFRKRAWEEVGGYPEVDDIEDLRLWVKMAAAGWKLANLPEVLGEHFVHRRSYWHTHFRYTERQRELSLVQWQAIRELRLPKWLAVYPLGRLVYPLLPNRAKRFVRRTFGRSGELDIARG